MMSLPITDLPMPGRRRVAVVDDNADNRLLVGAMLGGDFDLTMFEDGYSAIDGIRDMPPHVVLLDISLPGIDGVEVLRRLRSEAPLRNTLFIACTAHAMVGDEERFMELGFDGYLAKPILGGEQIARAIQQATTRSHE